MGIKNDRSIRLVINGADHQQIPIFCALHLYIRKYFQKTVFRTRKVKQKPEITEFCFIYETSRPLLLSHGILHPNHEHRKRFHGTHVRMYTSFQALTTHKTPFGFFSCPSLIYTHSQAPQLRFATNLHICSPKHENLCADLHIEEMKAIPTTTR